MDDRTKRRIRELMFHVVPDPDEIITDEILAQSEQVNYQDAQQMKAEFRSIIESLDDWMNVRDVMRRRIRNALAPVL